MKKNLLKLIASLSLCAPALTGAAGYSVDGNVQVFDSGTYQYMQAQMSVRFNPYTAGSPYVLANGYANSSVTFAGRDDQGEYFSCYVPTSSTRYAAAVDAKNNLQNGSRLYVYKSQGSSQCTNFSLGNYSYYLN